ncbi:MULTISPECIES: hypothetical protein [Aeromonas]|uniref:Uncharacterized protein n=2 Tax=Aeromonas TaxID=642 RepID=A0AAW5RVA0_AERME|nr:MULTISPECIES: hypothetical protein [Aeromonas]MCE9957564.1 hypothetical protein [Aeromonas rivipollensis]MCV3290752.1 hypothetical protein [Aeromonas media]
MAYRTDHHGASLGGSENRGLIADLRGLYGQFIALPAATATASASAGAAIGSRLQEAAVKELVTDEHAMVKGDLSFFWGNVNIL